MNPAERAAYLEASRREMYPQLLEAFDHRHDGLAAEHRFDVKLRLYAVLHANGSKCQVLGELVQAERRLQRSRKVGAS